MHVSVKDRALNMWVQVPVEACESIIPWWVCWEPNSTGVANAIDYLFGPLEAHFKVLFFKFS